MCFFFHLKQFSSSMTSVEVKYEYAKVPTQGFSDTIRLLKQTEK